jgi:hypothetical protein
MTKRNKTIGVIAEDDSDVESVKVLVHRIANNPNIGIKKSVGKGCGKIKRKCFGWSGDLKRRGCSLLILIHDRDTNNLNDLKTKIHNALNPCPIRIFLICIPIQELEAWLLSDPKGIQTALHMKKPPKVKGLPETINSPKERLGELIRIASQGEIEYINTEHNPKIAEKISINLVKEKCPSFKPFYDFVQLNLIN